MQLGTLIKSTAVSVYKLHKPVETSMCILLAFSDFLLTTEHEKWKLELFCFKG